MDFFIIRFVFLNPEHRVLAVPGKVEILLTGFYFIGEYVSIPALGLISF